MLIHDISYKWNHIIQDLLSLTSWQIFKVHACWSICQSLIPCGQVKVHCVEILCFVYTVIMDIGMVFTFCLLWMLLLSRFSHVRLCETPWTAAYQAPPSMGFSKQECWSGVPLPSPCSKIVKALSGRYLRKGPMALRFGYRKFISTNTTETSQILYES